ncbi:MAG TPA: aminotransferase class I/II-fold pyridoxal phosphate-dependent enzyme [Candidatus Limnocylindrales bacterium]|nr:aminotransferase class I/II-fold pyridoxal phosphate-dependent enzyme [Candidatus Limnocylindrales bacterium]
MSRSRTSSALELLVQLDRAGRDPLHRQLERALRGAVREGRLAPGAPVPSTRALADQLGISRGIVVEAYEQLVAEGYLASRPGGATTVARASVASPRQRALPADASYAFDFRPGRPDVTEFPRAAWLRSLRRVLTNAPSDRLTYLQGRAVPELARALATYLNRVRGTYADPADVVVSTGFAQGLALTMRALRASGVRRVAVEDPSDPEYRVTIRDAGLEWVAVPVDDDGIRVDRLPATRADAVVVTAAHQYPTGAVLSAERRAALLDWAARRGATIVEDDYDAEFRYDREPIGALQGLAPDRVVYAGSASKILAPGLRLGWLIAPPELTEALVERKQAMDMGSAALDQLAFADLLDRGDLDHHLRRMRPIYRTRRDTLLDALARRMPDVRPVGASAGLHVLAWLPDDVDEAAVIRDAAEAGIGIAPLSTRRVEPGPGGLIFGYGAIAARSIEDGVARLAAVIEANRHAGASVPLDGSLPLAVYGTLRRGETNAGLLAGARYLGTGWVDGRLHAMPSNDARPYGFPCLVPDPDGNPASRVLVELYGLAPGDLAKTDALEAFDPADEARSEYVRRATSVRDGPVDRAWVYVYNGPADAIGERIPNGDWVADRQWRGPA